MAQPTPALQYVCHNVEYMPAPNHIELFLTQLQPPPELVTSSFCLPVRPDDQAVLFAMHQLRGPDMLGGHKEPGETPEQTAVREMYEEAKARAGQLHQLGYMRLTTTGVLPREYKYPTPVSYQMFYACALAAPLEPYVTNSECAPPVWLDRYMRGVEDPAAIIWAEHARRVMAGAA
jgi:8-oxo-dGTP pyrophosphatase MutT (NUDIX family)